MNWKSAIANLKLLCWWFRQVSGDAAYENYLRSCVGTQDAVPPLSREDFYLDMLRRRYSSVSRCC